MKLKILSKRTVIRFSLVLLLTFSLSSLTAKTASSEQEVAFKKLDGYLDDLSHNNKMMSAVYVTKNGKKLYEHYSGMASMESDTSISAETRFRIGSITKTFTAILIMQLVEDGELSLETTLDNFYPKIPNAKIITIRHMLNHRSGIANMTAQPDFLGYMTLKQSQQQMEKRISAFKPVFEPNSQHRYSNSNYVLLG